MKRYIWVAVVVTLLVIGAVGHFRHATVLVEVKVIDVQDNSNMFPHYDRTVVALPDGQRVNLKEERGQVGDVYVVSWHQLRCRGAVWTGQTTFAEQTEGGTR